MSTHNLCFEQKYEKYQNFLSENFPFLVVKFSIYLNRCVFIMIIMSPLSCSHLACWVKLSHFMHLFHANA